MTTTSKEDAFESTRRRIAGLERNLELTGLWLAECPSDASHQGAPSDVGFQPSGVNALFQYLLLREDKLESFSRPEPANVQAD
jgi:hypothetical protein